MQLRRGDIEVLGRAQKRGPCWLGLDLGRTRSRRVSLSFRSVLLLPRMPRPLIGDTSAEKLTPSPVLSLACSSTLNLSLCHPTSTRRAPSLSSSTTTSQPPTRPHSPLERSEIVIPTYFVNSTPISHFFDFFTSPTRRLGFGNSSSSGELVIHCRCWDFRTSWISHLGGGADQLAAVGRWKRWWHTHELG